jgi:hypothetical protein
MLRRLCFGSSLAFVIFDAVVCVNLHRSEQNQSTFVLFSLRKKLIDADRGHGER